MPVWVYTIQFTNDMDAEEFGGEFSVIDIEGVEEKENELLVYLNDEQIKTGEAYINEICSLHQLSFTKTELENKNWNEAWEKSFQPLLVDEHVYIRAGFHPKNTQVRYEIIIDPKMSFGTGHHPTTYQMMQAMQYIDFQNSQVLDCGSGTGILAILAELSGAAKIVALDNDAWCFANVKENIQLNQAKNIIPVLGELKEIMDTDFDVILANIHRNYLLENLQSLAEKLVKKGKILISGFYETDVILILEKALEHNLLANYYSVQHGWACVVLEKK